MPYTEEHLAAIESELKDLGVEFRWPDIPNGKGYWIGTRKDGGTCTSPTLARALDFLFEPAEEDYGSQ